MNYAGEQINRRSAEFSPCLLYRYRLHRFWGAGPAMPFVMLNPSTADAFTDDPTIRRCVEFARREGAGGLAVVNLYAFRATKPADLWRAVDPIGPDNATHLRLVAEQARLSGIPVVCAWGAHVGTAASVLTAPFMEADRVCLGKTKHGHPRHPLYVRADQPLEPFP
jgi:hypothetical protein